MPAARRLLITAVLLALPLAAHAVPLFDTDYTGLPVGSEPRLLVAGDVTGDGIDDLVVDDADGIACLVARGDGTFAPLVRVSPIQASAIAIADLGGDGNADIAIVGQELPKVRIFLGRGNGTFDMGPERPAPAGSTGLLARDLDGDGRADLVASDAIARSLWIWMGLPGGDLSMPFFAATGAVPGRILAGDLDGDGAPELFVLHANAQAGFTLLRNTGLGLFLDPVLYDGPGGSKLGVTGDFDGDGIPDIAIPEPDEYQSDRDVAVWLGRRDGTFASPVIVPLDRIVKGTVAADLDGDGRDDLLVAGDRYQVLLRGSASGLLPPGPTLGANAMTAPIVTGRFDGDAAPDVASVELGQDGIALSNDCTIYLGSTVFVWRGDGAGGLPRAPFLATGGMPTRVLAVDLDGDGHVDLIAPIQGALGELAILRGRGDGAFDTPLRRNLPGSIRSLAAVDVDGDGRLELAAIAGGSLVVENVDANFGLVQRAIRPVGTNASELSARDFDGDGRVDFAVTNIAGPMAVRVFLAGEDFSWSTFRETRLPHFPTAMTAADLDHDGAADLLIGGRDFSVGVNPRLMHYRNKGDATFALVDSIETGVGPSAIAVLDRGSRLDPMVVTGAAEPGCLAGKPGVLVLKSVEGVLAREQGPLFVGGDPRTLAFADVTGDGLPDLIAAANRGRVSVRAGRPDGTYGDRLDFGVNAGVGMAGVADFDEDGRPDVAVASAAGIALMMNRGGAVYSPPAVAARLGAGGNETVLHYGDTRALPLVIAGTAVVDVRSIDPASVRLAGARAIPGRALVQDGVAVASPSFDACSTVLDDMDGRADLEVQFRADEVVDAWLDSYTTDCPQCLSANEVGLPFTARRRDGTTIAGSACAVIVGAPIADRQFAAISMRAFGLAPGFEAGVGVVLTVPAFVQSADVSVYDIAGRRVASLFHGSLGAGVHRLTWAGTGIRPGPGVYFARGDVDGTRLTARILVAR